MREIKLEEVQDAKAIQREHRTSRATQRVVDLLERHPELRGVHGPADLLDNSVRWSA